MERPTNSTFSVAVLLEFVRRTLAHLIEKRLSLTAPGRRQFILAKVIAQTIGHYCEQASEERYQQVLFGPEAAVETSFSSSSILPRAAMLRAGIMPAIPINFDVALK